MSNDALTLARQVHSATTLLVRVLRSDDLASGLTSAQRSVLSRLINNGPHTLGDLARAERVKPPTMTRLVQGLERQKYVVRKPGKEDKRVSHIDYTTKAWTEMLKAFSNKTNLLAERIEALSQSDQDVLQKALPIFEKLATR